jgi:hypothetical protein
MFLVSKRKFLFKCEECAMILAVEFEEPEDLERAQKNEIVLECPCGGRSKVLLD